MRAKRALAACAATLMLATAAQAAGERTIVRSVKVAPLKVKKYRSPVTSGSRIIVSGSLNGRSLQGVVDGAYVLLYGRRIAVQVGLDYYTVASFGGQGRLQLIWDTSP